MACPPPFVVGYSWLGPLDGRRIPPLLVSTWQSIAIDQQTRTPTKQGRPAVRFVRGVAWCGRSNGGGRGRRGGGPFGGWRRPRRVAGRYRGTCMLNCENVGWWWITSVAHHHPPHPPTQDCRRAAQALDVGELLCGPDFSLYDAMSALELMDPKMDEALQEVCACACVRVCPLCVQGRMFTPLHCYSHNKPARGISRLPDRAGGAPHHPVRGAGGGRGTAAPGTRGTLSSQPDWAHVYRILTPSPHLKR